MKHRYLAQGLPIAGTNERAREARALFDYYADLVTEIKLDARIDGADIVGTTPFGVFVNIRHTKQIEREAGGFQKYLQNQNSQQQECQRISGKAEHRRRVFAVPGLRQRDGVARHRESRGAERVFCKI